MKDERTTNISNMHYFFLTFLSYITYLFTYKFLAHAKKKNPNIYIYVFFDK